MRESTAKCRSLLLDGETAYLGGGESRPATSGILNYRSGIWSYPTGYSGVLFDSLDQLNFFRACSQHVIEFRPFRGKRQRIAIVY
jgi:hypothetical protein